MDRVGLIQVVKRSPFGAGIFDGREVDEVSLKVVGVLKVLDSILSFINRT